MQEGEKPKSKYRHAAEAFASVSGFAINLISFIYCKSSTLKNHFTMKHFDSAETFDINFIERYAMFSEKRPPPSPQLI